MKKKKILIVASKYYSNIIDLKLKIVCDLLKKNKISYNVIKVSGSFEIPLAISKNIKKFDGFIALGCIIKGETYHFEIVSNETNRCLMNIALKHSFPLGNGIITAFNYDQALKRSSDKGNEAALACYELIKINNYNNNVDKN